MELHEMVHISGRVWIIKKSFKMFPNFQRVWPGTSRYLWPTFSQFSALLAPVVR